MYKKSVFFGFFLLLGAFLVGSSFDSPESNTLYVVEKQQVQTHYHELLEVCNRAVNDWQMATRQLDSRRISVAEAKTRFSELRNAYKSVEFLLAYLEDEEVEEFINGGPLPTVDSKKEILTVNDPCGLQTIEETLYEDRIDTKKLVQLSQKLTADFIEIEERQSHTSLNEQMILEAARLNIIRAATLGISGFDTPSSGNALLETETSLSSTFVTLLPYLHAYEKKDSKKSAALLTLMQATHDYLTKNTDFDTFDRAEFIRNFTNPLFAQLLDMQLALGIETKPSERAKQTAVNLMSRNLFDTNFLNKSFFTNLTPQETPREVVELGKILFFDPALSENNQRACASCHDPKQGFGDGKRKSIAIDLETTVPRNAPTIINAVYSQKWFYDLRTTSMDEQIKAVITSEKEFHSNYTAIIGKLGQSLEYRALFKKAFGTYQISEKNIAKAIVAYEQSLTALNSPFDRYMRGETEAINPAVLRGFNIFTGRGNCATCHFAPTFSGLVPPHFHDSESEVLGVPLADEDKATIDPDLGRYNNQLPKENAPHYKYAFKTPTLRNAQYTAPYMHNGVFETLDDVIIFYNRGGGANIGIKLDNQTLSDEPLRLGNDERNDVVQFLQSLSDTTGVTSAPRNLPKMPFSPALNTRVVGGRF